MGNQTSFLRGLIFFFLKYYYVLKHKGIQVKRNRKQKRKKENGIMGEIERNIFWIQKPN